ncbi:prephenate dehydrogenase [Undibacterium squillarum]|uniref:prephenate dehydrogenase n=1 Tax=Undibacterium squillarum TaxID=1131567 RepID=UPI0035B3FB1D
MELNLKKITIAGVGLIGGSFALALRSAGVKAELVGIGRDPDVMQQALELGIVDRVAENAADAYSGADLILIAAPVAQTSVILSQILPFLGPDTVITDVGSTKADGVAAARLVMGERIGQFVPAHPIAGRELNGPAAAISDLYAGKKLVITALPENPKASVSLVEDLWKICGAQIHFLSPEAHDAVFASVSHLPHLLAYALVDEVSQRDNADTLFQYAASGFRDFTRIAGSSPEMWRDIAMANRDALLHELDAYIANVSATRTALAERDADSLLRTFSRAQSARQRWIEAIEAAEKDRHAAV